MDLKKKLIYLVMFTLAISPIVMRFSVHYPYQDKYYPYWTLDLFSRTKYITHTYSIFIHRIDDEYFENPVGLYELRPTVDGRTYPPHVLIDTMGKAIEQGDLKKYDNLKSEFLKLVFRKKKHVDFSMYKVSYNNIEKYMHNKNIKNELLIKDSVHARLE
jgi:hypothetical protein